MLKDNAGTGPRALVPRLYRKCEIDYLSIVRISGRKSCEIAGINDEPNLVRCTAGIIRRIIQNRTQARRGDQHVYVHDGPGGTVLKASICGVTAVSTPAAAIYVAGVPYGP
jgi:hypothetical protein